VAATRLRQPLEWWLNSVVKPLRYLISASTERPVLVEEIRLQPWATKDGDEVEIVWANIRSEKAEGESDPRQMLASFDDIGPKGAPSLSRWFTAVADLGSILDTFFASFDEARRSGPRQ